ncbi:ferritin [Candidatus Eisenbacteria bacterium]|uniref:Ferritin n=1 Tax=Eiseniibacteriota bacterium TaxID=2212470 RepID=A0ABV6YKN8_UNCEI
MLSDKMQAALNQQVNAELFSAYLYYSMMNYFESKSLPGCAHWMKLQALEEMTHARKLEAFVNERGGRILLTPIDGPETEWASPLAVFEEAYKHELKVTKMINDLVDLAIKESDHATNNFLQWFVGEQVEEEASADEVVQKLKLVDSTQGGLFMVDRELGQRAFNLPPEFGGGA